jgi:hypothetical protein
VLHLDLSLVLAVSTRATQESLLSLAVKTASDLAALAEAERARAASTPVSDAAVVDPALRSEAEALSAYGSRSEQPIQESLLRPVLPAVRTTT